MIRSMTGFGDAAAEVDGVHYAVELRSLNNKYFKLVQRIPDSIQSLEAELESTLRKRVHRGSFTLTIKIRFADARAASRVNEGALMQYLAHLETIQEKVSDHAVNIDLTQLLALPGVLQPAEDEEAFLARVRPQVRKLVQQAADRMDGMRQVEGQALVEDLLGQRAAILERIAIIRERAPKVVEEYHQRLDDRVRELLNKAELKVAEVDLIREVAIFADRADISEELSRLAGHLDQFETILSGGGDEPNGRTLDFLAQELLREANTIASKSNDAAISRAAVEVKSYIDRIKEQVQNVE